MIYKGFGIHNVSRYILIDGRRVQGGGVGEGIIQLFVRTIIENRPIATTTTAYYTTMVVLSLSLHTTLLYYLRVTGHALEYFSFFSIFTFILFFFPFFLDIVSFFFSLWSRY